MRRIIIYVSILFCFATCRPEYYTPDLLITTISGNSNTSGGTVFTFGSGTTVTFNVQATPFVVGSKLDVTYSIAGTSKSITGFPKTCQTSADVNTSYNFTSPSSSTYTLTISYTTPKGTKSNSYTINPTLTTHSSQRLNAYYSGSNYSFTFNSGASGTSYYNSDFYLSGSSTSFYGDFSTYNGYYIVVASLTNYNNALTQGDLDVIYNGGYTYSTYYSPSTSAAYIVRIDSPQNGRKYGVIKINSIINSSSYNDYMLFDYKY